MATPQDYQKYKERWPQWASVCANPAGVLADRVLLCSPNTAQYKLAQSIFPRATLMQRTEVEWDLNGPWKEDPVDVIIACNVFHYSRNPDLWFRNCFKACRYLWIQDLIARPRGIHGLEFSTTDHGDCYRYRFGDNLIPNRYSTFDLTIYESKVLAFELYDAGSFEAKKTMINFMALLRGDVE